MRAKSLLASLGDVLVPVVYQCDNAQAIELARALAPRVTLVGVVPLLSQGTLSAGASAAQELRRLLRQLGRGEQVRARSQVLVTSTPWQDLVKIAEELKPDLMLLDWAAHLPALGLDPATALAHPPANLGLLRGPLPKLNRVVVPVRGGPFAELALRVALNLRQTRHIHVASLHLQLSGAPEVSAPFHTLQEVLAQMPDIEQRSVVTDDIARYLIQEAQPSDLVVIGATARSGGASIGPVAERLLQESRSAVLVVATQRPAPATFDAIAGASAISLLVDKWFAENTFEADEFADIPQLVALKRQQGLTISLALPALNEEETVGTVIETVKRTLMDEHPLLDEIVLIDSNSTDRTREIARSLGIPVYIHQELLPRLGSRRGKGEALWKSLLVTRGDLIVWIDTDIVNVHPRFVYGIIGPMLLNPNIQFVKGFYRRPLRVGDKLQAGAGGRVTELTARPLINLFYPELSGVIQPLSGEYGGRRRALEVCPFFSGYGVETGLLIDIYERFGLSAIAQVDLLERIHHNQTLEALSKMSFAIIQAVMRKLETRYERAFIADVNKTMKLIRYEDGGYFLDVEEIAERERPPMIEVQEYRERFALTNPANA